MLVDHLRGERRLVTAATTVAVSVVTYCELHAGRDDADRLRRFLAIFVALPVDAEVASLAGATRRRTGIATPDALIAATALRHGLPLMTRNRRHFERVAELELVGPA